MLLYEYCIQYSNSNINRIRYYYISVSVTAVVAAGAMRTTGTINATTTVTSISS